MKKNILLIVITAVIAGGLGLWGGSHMGNNGGSPRAAGYFGNASGRIGGGQFSGRGQNAGGFVAGKVLDVGAESITVQLPNGGSQIVFFSTSTSIMKSVDGLIGDVQKGSDVVINGSQNADGSLTAQSIQLRTVLGQPGA